MRLRTLPAALVSCALLAAGCGGGPAAPVPTPTARRAREQRIRAIERDAERAFESVDLSPGEDDSLHDLDTDRGP